MRVSGMTIFRSFLRFTPTVETKVIPNASTISESYITFGAYVVVDTSDPKWQGRPVKVKVRFESRAGQPGSARIFVQDRGPVLWEGDIGRSGSDITEFEFWTLPGSNLYELEYRGHIGWSPNIEIVGGMFTITNE